MSHFDNANHPHVAVVNAEGMYSIWPEELPVPPGWYVQAQGTRAECLRLIDELWTDMRPRSLRQKAERSRWSAEVVPCSTP